ncbi:MAG TPA: VWA-like domain-containing protein [Acidobacteriaceae bacterium]|nr:VWA-like domain-containing protein [Acidobacteriaceae bacterium]
MPAVTRLPSEVRIQKARTTLLLDHPFFGTLLFRLGGKASWSIATMATDGVSLFYNPEFVETLNAAELAGVLAHEVMHPALQHHTRRGDRSPARWNMACDYAINPILLDAGLTLPKDVLVDNRFRGMSAERIYNLIEEDEKQEGSSGQAENQPGAGSSSPEKGSLQSDQARSEPNAPSTRGGVGQVLDAPEPEAASGPSVAGQAREWQIAVEQAETVAKVAGKLPGGAVRALEASQAAKVDWRELLRRAWSETIPADYSWTHPNRRHVWSGLYLPGITSEGVGEIAIAVDCSGSVSARQLGLFEAEIGSILEGQRPRLVHVLYFDAAIQRFETYQSGQPISLSPVGGGGTDFRPCFEWLEEHGIVPQTLVFLTDLCGTFPDEMPCYPVIWASTEARRAPFGEIVPIEAS